MSKFSRITQIEQHRCLNTNDICYYYGNYSPNKGFSVNTINNLIHNIKKGVDKKKSLEWRHKIDAVKQCASIIKNGFCEKWIKTATIILIPPSRSRTDPLYDDRLLQILSKVYPGQLDIRDCVYQQKSTNSAHWTGDKYSLSQLINLYHLDEGQLVSKPRHIIIFDDVINHGTHYRAVHHLINKKYTDVQITGLFLARVNIPSNRKLVFEQFS